MNFADFKKSQGQLKDAISSLKDKSPSYKDDRFWGPTKDVAGNATATIRFLPQRDLSKAPILETFRHGFQIKGRWFIEECPHTVGEKCPICEYASELWDSDEEEGHKHWRKRQYIANVLIIDDTADESNNGQVKLFKFGKKIYNMIMEAVAPEDGDDEAINVFDFDEGVNFKLKLTQVGGFNNYDKSKFMNSKSAIAGGDEDAQIKIFEGIIPLDEFKDKKKFKNYDQLREKFLKMHGSVLAPGRTVESDTQEEVKTKPAPKEDVPFDTGTDESSDSDTDSMSDDTDFEAILNSL